MPRRVRRHRTAPSPCLGSIAPIFLRCILTCSTGIIHRGRTPVITFNMMYQDKYHVKPYMSTCAFPLSGICVFPSRSFLAPALQCIDERNISVSQCFSFETGFVQVQLQPLGGSLGLRITARAAGARISWAPTPLGGKGKGRPCSRIGRGLTSSSLQGTPGPLT